MTAMIALLALMVPGGIEGGGEQPDCEKLPQAVKEQEDRYWKVYMGQLKGDELAEGAKLDQLTTKLKSCPAKPKTPAPKASAAVAPAPKEANPKPPEAQGAVKPLEVQTVAKPLEVQAAPRQVEVQTVAKPLELQTVAKPLELESVAKPLEGQTVAKPLEDQSAIAATGGSPLRQDPSPNEEAFCTIVREFAQQYRSLSERDGNELRLAELRSARAEALRQAMGTTQISSWTATLTKPRTTGDGDAVVQVRLPCGATLKTWNNAMTDAGSGTLIAHDSPLYGTLAKLHEDQLVVIDGHLFQGARDGFTELSFTEPGSMLHPEFLFRFLNIRAP
jgi:hypothetical protein